MIVRGHCVAEQAPQSIALQLVDGYLIAVRVQIVAESGGMQRFQAISQPFIGKKLPGLTNVLLKKKPDMYQPISFLNNK